MKSVFRFADPRQETIYQRLSRISPGPAAFFLDICRLMEAEPRLESTTHLVSHLLREIESGVRAVLEPLTARESRLTQSTKNTHEQAIRAILTSLEIGAEDPIAIAWLQLPTGSEGLAKRAHRNNLERPRPVDREFENLWLGMQAILDVVLKRLEERFLAYHRQLDELLLKPVPAKDDIKTLTQHIPNSLATRGYFFDRLHHQGWFAPLAAAGFFTDPPGSIADEGSGTVAFPVWYESRYLARIAGNADVRDQVIQAAMAVPETDNARIHEDLLDVLLAMPSSPATVAFLPKVTRWIAFPIQMQLPSKVGALVSQLALAGFVDDALEVARSLFAVSSAPTPPIEAASEATARASPKPMARFDDQKYGELIAKHLSDLVVTARDRALSLFSDLLDNAVSFSQSSSRSMPPQDYSWIWRPAIEEHGQNRHYDLRSLLVSAVRDAALQLVNIAPDVAPEVVRSLEQRQWLVFSRISLYVLSQSRESVTALAEERLVDHERFTNAGLKHEYVLLLAVSMPRLSEQARESIFGWIEQGPNVESFTRRFREEHGAEPSAGDLERYSNRWRRDWLASLRSSLPTDWERRYNALVQTLGEPDHPSFAFHTTPVWVGPTSPKSSAELADMPIEAVASFLRQWSPSQGWQAPSREGLGRELEAATKSMPVRFAGSAESFVGVHPTYVRAVLNGLTHALQEATRFSWPPILALCTWVMTQPRELTERPQGDDEDPDWGWTRTSVARILVAGFSGDQHSRLPISHRDQVWKLIEPLTCDPDPTPAYEAEYGGSNLDPVTMAANSTRGEAMHAAIQYCLWVFGQSERTAPRGGLDEIPEARVVLEQHLEASAEGSLAVRSVYGRCFSRLAYLDREWADKWAPQIFPTEDRDLWEAAWDAYLTFSEPEEPVFAILRPQYDHAVELLALHIPDLPRLTDPNGRLAEHLMILYWQGALSLDEPTSLLLKFVGTAPDAVRGMAMEFLGRALGDTDVIPASVKERLTQYWLAAVSRARGNPRDTIEELAHFGWWFISGKLDEHWAIQQLEAAIALVKRIEPGHIVLGKLAELARRWPLEAERCVAGLLEDEIDPWRVLGLESQARSIIAAALASGNETARDESTALIHRLAARGHIGFRDLLAHGSNREPP